MQLFAILAFFLVRASARAILSPVQVQVDFGADVVRHPRTVTYTTMTHPLDALPIDAMLPYQVEQLGGKARLVVHLVVNRGSPALAESHPELLARFDERVASLMRYVDKVFTLDQSQIKPPSGNQAAEYTAGVRLAREKCATPYCLWIDPDMFVVARDPAVWLRRSTGLLEGSVSAAPWPFVRPHYLGAGRCINATSFSSQFFLWKAGRDSFINTPLGDDTFEAAVQDALKTETREAEKACDLGLRVVHPPDDRRTLAALLRKCGDESGGTNLVSFRRGLRALQKRLDEGGVPLGPGGVHLSGDGVCTNAKLPEVARKEEAAELQTKHEVEAQEYKDKSGHDSRNPKLYCYAFLRSPLPPVTALLGHQLSKSCDDWDLFSSESNRDLRVTKLYNQSDFDRDWKLTMRGPVVAAWKHLLEKYDGNPFDWVIKLDYDSFVRPSTFRDMFARYTTEEPLILSADEDYTDGFFDAVNSKAAKAVLPEAGVLGTRHALDFTMVNCTIILSGHNNDGVRSPPHHDSDTNAQHCAKRAGVKVHFPEDSNGNGLLVTHVGNYDPRCCRRPVLSREQLFGVAGEGSRCFPTKTDTKCISQKFAVVHPVKDLMEYQWLANKVG